MTTGRFAPSPSGDLHLGNLRTAVLAWALARAEGGRFLIRMEDLTTEKVADSEQRQLADLESLGITSDDPVVRSSDRQELYRNALGELTDAGLTYPCFCSRREIREAVAAPHDAASATGYPGTCARLTSAERSERMASGRPPALRLRAGDELVEVHDDLAGPVTSVVDDFVLRRGDGMPAYNLAVVVDDSDQGIDQVVRGDDLLATTHRQVLLCRLLGLAVPRYCHVPLVLGSDGEPLSKRNGARSLAELAAAGVGPGRVLGLFAESFGMAGLGDEVTIDQITEHISLAAVSRGPWRAGPEAP